MRRTVGQRGRPDRAGSIERRVLPALALVVGLALAVGLAPPVSPAVAQDVDDGSTDPPCLLALDEVAGITGLTFDRVVIGDAGCIYEGADPTGSYMVDIRFEDRGMPGVMAEFAAGGTSTSIRGMPAWVSDDGAWVDLGDRRLAVLPILFFSTETPDASSIVVPLAEEALGRLGITAPASPRPSVAAPSAGPSIDPSAALVTWFPREIAGVPLVPTPGTGGAFLAELDAIDTFRAGLFRDAITGQGRSPDEMETATGSVEPPGAGRVTVAAFRLRDGDVGPLLVVMPFVLSESMSLGTSDIQIDGRPVTEVQDATLGVPRHMLVSGDVLWVVDAPVEILREVLRGLP
ncbi:MAG: hypothetical protein KF809_13085 [Chloroflexi bacterium]|nr:hypothetical protein [Chloroflexota bacterium]